MSTGEIACSYAALILYDDNIPITAEKIATLVKTANVPGVDSYWFSLFAKLAEKRNIGELILKVGAGGGAAVAGAVPAGGAAGGAGAAAAAPTPAEKQDEPKEERDDDMGFSLSD